MTFFKTLLTTAALAVITLPAVAAEKSKVSVTDSEQLDAQGNVVYQERKVVTRDPIKPGHATFYYYDPDLGKIVTGKELTDRMIGLWDKDNNKVIDNHEFYTNALI